MDLIQRGFIVVDSPRGNDAIAQRDSWSNPFATVSKAFEFIQDNDTILIYPGPYLEKPQAPTNAAYQTGGGAALYLHDHQGVTMKGIGMPEIWFTSHGNGLLIENCTNVAVDGVRFRGMGMITQPSTFYFALLLLNGINEAIRVRNCILSESGNHGIAHLFGPRTTNNSVFENNQCLVGGNANHPTLGWDGAAIAVGGSGNRFYGNRIERWLRGFEFESGSFPGADAPTSRNICSHNKLLQCWYQHVAIMPTHRQAALFDQNLIEGNILQGWGDQPPENSGLYSSFAQDGIYLAGGVNMQIRGNDISDMWGGLGCA